ncbi:hypothetical protein GGF46_004654 [Coemansia sp. RSA 552]|nr:hypothetical protein GGF46_004654 [Coemansia sp. RSA 552]
MAIRNPAAAVWNNDLIVSTLLQYFEQDCLHTVVLTSRRGFAYGAPFLWRAPVVEHLYQFNQLVAACDKRPPTSILGCSQYGHWVRTIDLSMLNKRWEANLYSGLHTLVMNSPNVVNLDLNLCGSLHSTEFIELLKCNPLILGSLTSLNIRETSFSDSAMMDALFLLPNLEFLDITDTCADDGVMAIISEHNKNLVTLYIGGDYITEFGVQCVVDNCPKLKFINFTEFTGLMNEQYLIDAGIQYAEEEYSD